SVSFDVSDPEERIRVVVGKQSVISKGLRLFDHVKKLYYRYDALTKRSMGESAAKKMSVSMQTCEFTDKTLVLLDEGFEHDLLDETCLVEGDETNGYKVLRKIYNDTGNTAATKEEACRKAYNLLVEEWANLGL